MAKKIKNKELTVKDCTINIDIDKILIKKNKEDENAIQGRFLGQEKAIKSLEAGVHIKSSGYNIFVCGIPGTGRMTAVQKMINKIIDEYPLPSDLCYIYNFDKPDEPILLEMPRGEGIRLKQKMDDFLRGLFSLIPQIIEDDGFISAKNRIIHQFSVESRNRVKELGAKLDKDGFALVEVEYRDGKIPDIFMKHEEKAYQWEIF